MSAAGNSGNQESRCDRCSGNDPLWRIKRSTGWAGGKHLAFQPAGVGRAGDSEEHALFLDTHAEDTDGLSSQHQILGFTLAEANFVHDNLTDAIHDIGRAKLALGKEQIDLDGIQL